MKTLLLVFDDGANPLLDLDDVVQKLDDDAQVYALDGHVCFIRSNLDSTTVSAKFMAIAGSNVFFVTDVSESDYSGRMVGAFWEFFGDRTSIASAA